MPTSQAQCLVVLTREAMDSAPMSKKPSKSTEMFDSLVGNAFDFLEHSSQELEISPKYSLINFTAAIELLLKARLMLEHWSLIIEEPQKANLSQFLNGDFRSIGMEEAIQRLKSIANSPISDKERRVFHALREHRNKLVHFFHPNYVGRPDHTAIESVVVEQGCGSFETTSG